MRYVSALLAIAGLSAVLYGLWLVTPALALVVGGLIGLALSFACDPDLRSKRERAQ